MTVYPTAEDLLILCDVLGGLHVRDLGLLDSAAHRPTVRLFGVDAYPDVHTKAAVLLESIVRNHPLVDGNKRLGWVAIVVFYGLNGIELHAPEDSAYDLVISVASGDSDVLGTASSLSRWTHTAS